MLEAVNAHLARKGQSLQSGTIVDATLIAAPSSTKNADGSAIVRTGMPDANWSDHADGTAP
ncbi:hypothetical protein XACS582_14190001 [Xanthomonas citri pv. citri]|nr:hypothetical protein XACS582_14190001 [Xanthomonas citri pv. citri]